MTSNSPRRAIVFIDGFNLYHAIDNLNQPQLKWLCLQRLSLDLTGRMGDLLVQVYYFSAFAYHRHPSSVTRHKAYVEALKIQTVQCILGKFKERQCNCRSCQAYWNTHEEKETDVNIALHILSEALKDSYDRAYVISADSDLSPAFRMVKNQCPDKELITVSPPKRFHSKEIAALADHKLSITVNDLANCQLPDAVHRADGKVFTRPLVWS